jgi:hypothetical protein
MGKRFVVVTDAGCTAAFVRQFNQAGGAWRFN